MTTRNNFNIPLLPSDFDTFQKTVVAIMIAKATLYGIPATSITNLAPKTAKWNGYVLICETEATKGPGATANRNGFQEEYSKAISIIIEDYLLNNVDVTDADKLSFHIHPYNGVKVGVPDPTSTVVANVTYMEPLAQYFSFVDSVSGKRARPKAVSFVELRYTIATVAPASVDDCNSTIFLNRSTRKIQFVSVDATKTAYYFGRYVNKYGQYGPWCTMFSAVII